MKGTGLDEAGRGAVIGSMFVAAVCDVEEDYRDSKTLSKSAIFKQAKYIMSKYKFCVLEVTPAEIDSFNLNVLTADYFIKLINSLQTDTVYVDSCWANADSLKKYLQSHLKVQSITVEHKADSKYNCVSAAGIIAKYHRELHVIQLHKKVGYFGSGYPSDPTTKKFLITNPNIIERRKKWQIKS